MKHGRAEFSHLTSATHGNKLTHTAHNSLGMCLEVWRGFALLAAQQEGIDAGVGRSMPAVSSLRKKWEILLCARLANDCFYMLEQSADDNVPGTDFLLITAAQNMIV